MNRRKLTDARFLRIHFVDDHELVVDVNNNDSVWEDILSQKGNIIEIETAEWKWNLLSGEVVFH